MRDEVTFETRGAHALPAGGPLLVAIVGIDGCGKSATFHRALELLAPQLPVAGVGDEVWSGDPTVPLHVRNDVPHARIARFVGARAKGTWRAGMYRRLKLVELAERARTCEHLARAERPSVLLTDGSPLVNTAAWSAARYYRDELAGDSSALRDVIDYLGRAKPIPAREIPSYLRRAWPLVVLNRLSGVRFAPPDLVVLLEIDPAAALARIRARGRPLQAHETEPFLAELARAYDRVCRLLRDERGVEVLRIPVGEVALEEVAARVDAACREAIEARRAAAPSDRIPPTSIEVVATTISGSLADQRKLPRIAPAFAAQSTRDVHVYPVGSHAEARDVAHRIVAAGGRILVSAGGAGTCNAVIEGTHVAGSVPADVRLGFLRKGSADLIGKALGVPDDLDGAVSAIVDGIEHGRCVEASVLACEADDVQGQSQLRHLVGFGGVGVFGDVPRFTETRVVKYYKGVLGQLFGDLGPFYTGLTLATLRWIWRDALGRVPDVEIVLDGEPLPGRRWATIVWVNGDLGRDFQLGRGLPLGADGFRVIAFQDRGVREGVRQILACRDASVLDDPERFAATVRTVRSLEVRPAGDAVMMVNLDGLRMPSRGTIRVYVSGRIRLIGSAM